MSMTIQPGVKDKILATSSETPRVENAPAEMLRDMDQQMEGGQMMVSTLWIKLYSEYEYEIRYHPSKANVVTDALSRKERVKPRRVPLVGSEMDEAHASRYLVRPGADKKYYNLGDMYCLRYLSENEIESPWIFNFQGQSNNSKEWNSGDDQLRLRWMIYLVVLAGAAKSVRDAMWFENCLASSSGWTRDWESSLTGLELVQETTDKVVLVKEKLKAARDRQKSYVNYGRKPLEFEGRDCVLLKVPPWKGVVRFGKKACVDIVWKLLVLQGGSPAGIHGLFSGSGKLRDRNAKESWALLEGLALYDNESWNDPRDFAESVKAISLPQDVSSTSDCRLIELKNQVQRLMEAHLALTQPTQVNKITT
ncbi:hypothetical protein Tco_1121204 [Tanacetum coccineum]|uniref:Reverse transcriptase domain-containing protein n=1 Tax=Tanacetum coccineum TaxID=301880 RepID=A0ABQ5IX84_9ASTR